MDTDFAEQKLSRTTFEGLRFGEPSGGGSDGLLSPGRGRRAGFSLIELVVVLVVIMVLTVMSWAFLFPDHQRQQRAACQQNLQRIHIALGIYASDLGGRFPVAEGARTAEEALDVLVPRYTVDTTIFICPVSRDALLPSGESFRSRKISYAYYMGQTSADPAALLMSDRQVDTQPKSAGQYAFSQTGDPPGNNHQQHGGNFLFCDGHVVSSPARVPFSLVTPQGVVLLNPRP
jgi:prepilin-type processing-associated H-X9-DG protein